MKQRVATALLLLPAVALAAFAVHPLPVAFVCAVVAALSTGELLRLVLRDRRSFPLLTAAAVVLVLATAGLAHAPESGFLRPLLAFGAPFVLGLAGLRLALMDRAGAVLGGLYPAAGLSALAAVHAGGVVGAPEGGFAWNLVVLLTFPVWAGDSIAIFAGRAFGRRKLAPGVSPNKTVEGAMAHAVAGAAIGVVVAPYLRIEWWQSGVVAIAISLLAQAGDLLESALKRHAGVKDSGVLLPGHGGLLDRIDGLLLSAPIGALILYLMGLLN